MRSLGGKEYKEREIMHNFEVVGIIAIVWLMAVFLMSAALMVVI